MKSLKAIFLGVFILLSMPSFSATGGEGYEPKKINYETATAKQLENRLKEIEKMDVKSFSRAEKKELRKELKAIKKASKRHGSTVTISIGALIIIILLLIIIF
jgi:hypothetical protein